MAKMRNPKGFTLLELLIVVAIIGILASFIYPSYSRHSQSAYRTQAQVDLLDFATAMEKHKATTFSYRGAAGTEAAPTDTGVPWIFSDQSPANNASSEKVYSLTIHDVSSNGRAFEIRATPFASGPVGSGSMKEGMLSYFSDGRKAYDADKNGAYAASEYCWSC